MALVAGSVSVNSSEIVTGSDMALALYNADAATIVLPALPILNSTAAPWRVERPVSQADIDAVKAGRVATLQEAARRATAYALAIVGYFHAFAVARVGTSTSTGRTPNPNNADTAIQPPASNVDLPIL